MALRKRKQCPPFYREHGNYKPFLRLDFLYQCGYCDFSEPERGNSRIFHVDHYKPKDSCKNLEEQNDYQNLIYACPICNRAKWDFWSTRINRIFRQVIIDPCKIDPEKHIDKSKPRWTHRSLLGYWNIDRLLLSSDDNIRDRQDRENIRQLISELENEIAVRIQQPTAANDPRLPSYIQDLENKIQSLRRKIEGPKD